ncbi:MAG: tetratricopeptide repeat protein [Gemmatimonas sp.]
MDTPTAALKQATTAHQAGRLDDAERLYRSVLAADPRQFDALHLLGVVEAQRGRFAAAEPLLRAALDINPAAAQARAHFSFVLTELKRYDEALANCDAALAAQPGDAELLRNRAMLLTALRRNEEAIAAYDRLEAVRTDHRLLNDRANLLMEAGCPDEALADYDRALSFATLDAATRAQILNNRGVALAALQRYEESLETYERALALKPDVAEALNNRGSALFDLRRFGAALESFERALALKPRYADALNNRANTLVAVGRHEEALAAFDRVLAERPNWPAALANRANALMELRRFDAAAADLARAVAAEPGLKYGRGKLLYLRLHSCDWSTLPGEIAGIESHVDAGRRVATPFAMLAFSDSPERQLTAARLYVEDTCPPSPSPLWRGEPYDHERIRVAYVSCDFREHAVGYLMPEMLERHDTSRFETFGIALVDEPASPTRRRIADAVEHFIPVDKLSDADAARVMREHEIDIAVDLSGFTQGARPGILAHRPAPVQVNWFGYPGTMGADYIDYIIADRLIIPAEHEVHFAEKVVCLPDSYQPNDSRRPSAAPPPSRSDAGLPDRGFVFCSFNQTFKTLPTVFDIWMRLLRAIDGSVLWLLDPGKAAAANLRREAQARGVAGERIVFAPRVASDRHLARHAVADLFLDTLPYNAHVTASDALWAGLPIVTCPGRTFAARVCGSLLSAAGVPELVARSLADYEDLALRLARDPSALGAIRRRLVENRATCRLFDTDRLRRHIEAAYEIMWRRTKTRLPPQAFSVPPLD